MEKASQRESTGRTSSSTALQRSPRRLTNESSVDLSVSLNCTVGHIQMLPGVLSSVANSGTNVLLHTWMPSKTINNGCWRRLVSALPTAHPVCHTSRNGFYKHCRPIAFVLDSFDMFCSAAVLLHV